MTNYIKENCKMSRQYDICEFDEYFQYKKGQIVNDNTIIEYIKLKKPNGEYSHRGYLCKCIHDGYVRPIEQYHLSKGFRKCSVCDNKVVIQGINDVATTQPELVVYLHDKSLANSITRASDKLIDLECPICHTVKSGRMRDLGKHGFSCPKCSDGRTVPNKIMYLILEQSGFDFECEVFFKWCSFNLPHKIGKKSHGVYDFVIESEKLIIEMDGGLGHGKRLHSRSETTLEETLYRDRMKDQLAYEHGYKVIRIDCDWTEDNKYDYLYNSLCRSEIVHYIDIEHLNLKALFDEASNTSLVYESCVLWNNGMSLKNIGKQIKYGKATVRKYLRIGASVGLCNYDDSMAYERGKEQFSNGVYEYSLHFETLREFTNFLEIYNIPLNLHTIQNRFVKGNTGRTVIDGFIIERKK